MAAASKAIFIIGAKRTPFCRHGGPLRELPASYAFAAAAKDAIKSANLDPIHIDNTVVGNINFLSQCDGGKTPRYCGIYSGVPISSPALGVNKACGTGLQAIVSGAVDILSSNSQITLTGGTDIMSALPMLVRNVRFGTSLAAPYLLEDHIKKLFPDSYTGKTLQKLEEDLAKKYGVTRNDVDEFALQSHMKWKAAQEAKIFDQEVTSLTVTLKDKEIDVTKDELPQPTLKKDDLNKLLPLIEEGDMITSGNTSVPADGAAALVIASENAVTSHELRPLARVAAWTVIGVDPLDTGVAALRAIRKLLYDHKLKVQDIDLFEINETFASQVLITARQLNIELDKVNVNGGALALGHPVSATGARMATHLVHELRRRNLKRAIAASSCGGGQGIAVLLENM